MFTRSLGAEAPDACDDPVHADHVGGKTAKAHAACFGVKASKYNMKNTARGRQERRRGTGSEKKRSAGGK